MKKIGNYILSDHDLSEMKRNEVHTVVSITPHDHNQDPYLTDMHPLDGLQAPRYIPHVEDFLRRGRNAMVTDHFLLSEMVASSRARRLGIDNIPSQQVFDNMYLMANELMEPMRRMWDHPIIPTSWYRCPRLNRAVGGSPTSQHVTGQAVDFKTVPLREEAGVKACSQHSLMQQLFEAIILRDDPKDPDDGLHRGTSLSFDQLIWERGGQWIHISYVSRSRNRHQILASPKPGVYVGIAHNWREVVFGGTGKWGNGEMGTWGNGETGRE